MTSSNPTDHLAAAFEAHRSRLRAVAYRMLGAADEADDAVQEAWLRLARTDADAVQNLGGFLTTTVARICLDALRSRKTRGERALDDAPEAQAAATTLPGPEDEATMADSVGQALLVVLDTLTPAERLAFVLHDVFDVPFEQVATVLDRTPTAARQLASRARRRVQGAGDAEAAADLTRRQQVVGAFLAASREGDFGALLALLDPNAVLRADAAAVAMAQRQGVVPLAPETRGAQVVAETFSGRAKLATAAMVDGEPAAVFAMGGRVMVVFRFEVEGDAITAVDLLADAEAIAAMAIEVGEG